MKNTFIHGIKYSLNGIDGEKCSTAEIVKLLKNQNLLFMNKNKNLKKIYNNKAHKLNSKKNQD